MNENNSENKNSVSNENIQSTIENITNDIQNKTISEILEDNSSLSNYENNMVDISENKENLFKKIESNEDNNNFTQNTINSPKKKKKTWVILLIIFGSLFLLGLLVIIGFIILFSFFNKKMENNKIFKGEGYTLEYDNNWKTTWIKTTSGASKEGLSYKKIEDVRVVPIGTSKLDELNYCDFDLSSCKKNIYDKFYTYINSSMSSSSLYLYKDSKDFTLLKDDIYIASYDYGKSQSSLRGKEYLLISKDKNVILSFMSNSTTNLDQLNEIVTELFKTIKIEKQELTNDSSITEEDKQIENMLNSLSKWNTYSQLRTDNLNKTKGIEGNWRILSDSETYWVFKNGEFWWYKSINDLNDNYWYGTVQIKTGKDGLLSVGLDESKVDNIISKNSNIKESDIYSLIMTPKKIISGGVDKSSTNIPSNSTWKYLWVVVDHGNEGIEGQVINLNSSDPSYYVKLSK